MCLFKMQFQALGSALTSPTEIEIGALLCETRSLAGCDVRQGNAQILHACTSGSGIVRACMRACVHAFASAPAANRAFFVSTTDKERTVVTFLSHSCGASRNHNNDDKKSVDSKKKHLRNRHPPQLRFLLGNRKQHRFSKPRLPPRCVLQRRQCWCGARYECLCVVN